MAKSNNPLWELTVYQAAPLCRWTTWESTEPLVVLIQIQEQVLCCSVPVDWSVGWSVLNLG